MSTPDKLRWIDFPVGVDKSGNLPVSFLRREWDLGSEGLIGLKFYQVVPELIRRSCFHPTMFQPPTGDDRYIGGIIQTVFKIYKPVPHEAPLTHQPTGTRGFERWVPVEINPRGNFDPASYNPLEDNFLRQSGIAVSWGSRVGLNNLSLPGQILAWGHLPMFDIIKPPTSDNVAHLIKEIKARCRLERFLVIRSSDHGMMVVGLEIVDEAHLEALWDNAELINHYEKDKDDVWFDSRWHARSRQNFIHELGPVNLHRICGILRVTAAPPLKPEEPVVIAASF